MKFKSIVCLMVALMLALSSILFVIPIGIVSYATSGEVAIREEQLPSEYCMRDEYIVYAQNQDSHGYCWNFAATMAASTTLMKATGEYYDFSELWTGISLSNCTKKHNKIGQGGTFSYQYDAMQQSGLMLETDLPYQDSYTVSKENSVDYYNFYEKYSNDDLAGCLVYDGETSFSKNEIEKIKSHIYNHGSVYMSFSFRTGFIEKDGAYALEPNQTNTNSSHAVSVIGWDDNYQREYYFNGSSTPTVFKGAWIILNSYTEKNGNDGISFVFYNDNNIGTIQGYRYEQDTSKDLYFYDKIESGYAYPTALKGKYYGDFTAEACVTKQKNIFYDDVNLEYSYTISSGARIKSIDIYLDGNNVTDSFDVRISQSTRRFSISKKDADYGQYKLLVTYENNEKSDTYLNNFFVTHGLVGEEVEFDYDKNDLTFNSGRDMEFYSFISSDKNYVIYTDKLSGEISFLPTEQSVYSDKNMSLPNLSYNITNGNSCIVTHSITAGSGYKLDYNFVFEYYSDTSLQPVKVYYDLAGGVNHSKNYSQELASATTDLVLYEPTRPGYTFEGWYLDYGNGSRKLSEVNDLHYISWDDIHHLGEAPSIHALSNYNKYYNSSNTVFVYAHWKEIEYYNVDMTVIGEGSTQISDSIYISSEDCVRYLLKPKTGWCVTEVTINGEPVNSEELLEINKHGLQIKNIDRDTSIVATFKEGVYISLEYGENIKTAYLIGTYDGNTQYFYNGDFIPAEYFTGLKDRFDHITPGHDDIIIDNNKKPIVNDKVINDKVINDDVYDDILNNDDIYDALVINDVVATDNVTLGGNRDGLLFPGFGDEFTLVVELYDDGNGYTYVLDNQSSYKLVKDRIYEKSIVIKYSDGFKEINVGSAQRKVKLTYTVNSYILDHYLSANINANSGSKNVGIYDEGQTVYLFVKTQDDTPVYHYRLPDGFESIGNGWYRMTLLANADGAALGEIGATEELKTYTVTWNNWDGSIIYSENYPYGATPVFNNKNSTPSEYPIRPNDKAYQYSFVRWDNPIESVTCDVTYTAVYESELIKYTVSVEPTENGAVTPNGSNFITNLDQHTYTFIPDSGYMVKDVILNGVSIGACSSYTFADVSKDQTLRVEFETLKHSVNVICGDNGSADIAGVTRVEHDSDLTVNITPDELFDIEFIKIDGVLVDITESLTVSNITGDMLIEIGFKQVRFNITTSNSSKGSETSSLIIDIGESARIEFSTKPGYKIKDVLIDGVSVGAVDCYTFTNVMDNHTVHVEYGVKVLPIVIMSSLLIVAAGVAVAVPLIIRKRRAVLKTGADEQTPDDFNDEETLDDTDEKE